MGTIQFISIQWSAAKYLAALLILLSISQLCNAQDSKVPQLQGTLVPEPKRVITNDTAYVDIKGKAYPFLGLIPMELRTPEQLAYLKKLYRVLVKYYEVENNHQVFKLDELSFLKMGLSKYDYRLVVKGMEDNNKFFDANGVKDVDRLNQEWKTETEAWLNK